MVAVYVLLSITDDENSCKQQTKEYLSVQKHNTMKRFLFVLSAIAILFVSNTTSTSAQSVNVNINIGKQPAWGPVGYNYVGYYYFPEIDVYYNVDHALFHYWDGRHWVAARYLPPRYTHYDLYRTYKVVINDRNPWQYNGYHRKQYNRYKSNRNQVIILNSRDNRYRNSRNNRVVWVEPQRNNGRNTSVRSSRSVRSGQTSRETGNRHNNRSLNAARQYHH